MAQKELKGGQEKPDMLDKVPSKIGFLDSIDAELTYAGYKNVGHVAGASVSATYGPLTVGVGAGAEKLDYYYKALFYVTPKLEVRGILGDFELYGVGSMPIMPETGETRTSLTTYGSTGTVWEPVYPRKGNRMSFRLGMELKAVDEWNNKSTVQALATQGFGAAFGYGPVTAYAIEDVIFSSEKPYEQEFKDGLRQYHHKVRAGVVVNYGKMTIRGEFSQATLEMGGELSFEFRTKYCVPEIRGWYSKEDEALGGANKVGIGLNLAFGWGGLNARTKVEGGFDIGEGTGGELVEWEFPDPDNEDEVFESSIKDSKDISEFAAKYCDKGSKSIIYAAIRLGSYGAYIYKDGSAAREKQLAEKGEFEKIRQHVLGGEAEGGVCTNIGSVQATFLRKVGWDAYGVTIVSGKTSHYMAIAKNPENGEAYLLTEGRIHTSPKGNILPLLREYVKGEGVIPQGIHLYGKGNKIIGYYELEEGKLNRAMAGDEDTLKDALLHSRPKKRKK